MSPSYAVTTERVGADIRRRLAEPGVLKGRQRSPAFIEQVIGLGVRIALVQGGKADWHLFPLARWPLEKLWGVSEWVIKRALPILQRIGFLIQHGETVRRVHTGTQSVTPGSKPYWFCPHVFQLDPAIHRLLAPKTEKITDAITARFLAEVGATVAASVSPSQCAPDETLNVKDKEEEELENIKPKLRLQGALAEVVASWERVLHQPRSPVPPAPVPRRVADHDYANDPRVLAEKVRRTAARQRIRYLPEEPTPAEPYPDAPKNPGYDYSKDARVRAWNKVFVSKPAILTPLPPYWERDYANDPRVLADKARRAARKVPESQKPMIPRSASPRVAAFIEEWPAILDIIRDEWPLMFVPERCHLLPEVEQWLRNHVGGAGYAWSITRVNVPGEQWHNPKGRYFLGFREEDHAFEFRMRWK